MQITARGKEVLAERPERVDMQLLSRFDDYLDYWARTNVTVRLEVVAQAMSASGARAGREGADLLPTPR
ncbi:hypothetical protein [Pseudonocardia asaccharolytica]|uniref:hypothetical protein n=1 Tax=Pseudonocardia asaccharolytica TaxID=54010 RepID=UPI000427A34B|nr:hypothetical protein [Pseudonocardia asaccharolytica]